MMPKFPLIPLKYQVRLIIFVVFLIGVYLTLSCLPSITYTFGFDISESQGNISLRHSKIAVCLVGGARRFELTGPSIIDQILRVYPNADVFVHCPLDSNAYKLLLLNDAPKLTSVRIFNQMPIPEDEIVHQTIGGNCQNLLQYFNLVEGCLTLINAHQAKHNFTYDWIIRARVDSYWSEKLGNESFNVGKYTVPDGTNYGGLNDRFGVGDYNTSVVALSRLSALSRLRDAGLSHLHSESAYLAQFKTLKVEIARVPVPMCILTDHTYQFPPITQRLHTVALTNPGPQNGSYCRPCSPICVGSCDKPGLQYEHWVWTEAEWKRDRMEVCDASGPWEDGWEKLFDESAGEKNAAIRKGFRSMNVNRCIWEFEKMQNRTEHWDTPSAAVICEKGLKP